MADSTAIGLERLRKGLIAAGTLCLASAVALLLASFGGVISMEEFAIGAQSGLRTLASVAVAGCLMIAVGAWEN